MPLEVSRLDQIFSPQSVGRFQDMITNSRRLVHYTSAEAAMLMIAGKSVWLRNTLFMNDFSEIEHALQLLGGYFGVENTANAPFWDVIDRTTKGRATELRGLFDGWSFDMSTATFVACLSEHKDEEDKMGRLSMWRAYGKPHSVALVINPGYLAGSNAALEAYSFPVEYCDALKAKLLFDEVFMNVIVNEKELAAMDPQAVFNSAFECLHNFALTLKHPGFEEEREWRIIHRPNYRKSAVLVERLVAIGGAPQKVYALPLEDIPQHDIVGITPDKLIDHIIIGPSEYSFAMWRGFVETLANAGVSDPEKKVHCSEIPVR